MQRVWLAATAAGLAAHPYGALPQYLTKVDLEPERFLPEQAEALRGYAADLNALLKVELKAPAILLRIGRPLGAPAGRNLRLPVGSVTC